LFVVSKRNRRFRTEVQFALLAYLLMIGTSVGRKRECVRISRQHASGMKLCGERFSGNSAAAVFIEKELPMRWEAAPKALFCVITLPFS